jgi:C4-dicarboxylate-binding protein DctP
MKIRASHLLAAAAALLLAATSAGADTFHLRIASGNQPGIEYVDSAANYFVPELKRRVKERTGHTLEISEHYSGSLFKANQVLDATRAGEVDFGLFCVCHEGQKLKLNNFMFLAPFSPTDPVQALHATRAVYARVPQLTQNFEAAHKQALLALMPLEPYDLLSTFEVRDPSDLGGHRVSGSGPNHPWIAALGATPVTTQGQHDHDGANPRYEASIGFVSLATSLELYKTGMSHFVRTGLGSQVILVLTMNKEKLASLPPAVRAILLETAADFERLVAERTRDHYEAHVREVAAKGMKVSAFTQQQRTTWAARLAGWSAGELAKLDAQGLAGSVAVQQFVAEAEKLGHVWPVRYVPGP